jgi:hypothetical protein
MIDSFHDFATIPLAKDCILVLTPAEYDRTIVRGKTAKRREAFEARMAKLKDDRCGNVYEILLLSSKGQGG